MPFSYANPLSGQSAGSVDWFNFKILSIIPGQAATGLIETLSDGTTIPQNFIKGVKVYAYN